jgi:hypothetical protein
MPDYVYGNLSETPSAYNQVARVINTACDWACNIANDNSHGYSQSNRCGPNYDCSSLVISAFRAAGLTINANSTHDMLTGFSPELGFKHIPWYSGMQLYRGDVLLKPASHTALYVGDGLVVEAHLAENGTIYGATGDQGYYMYNGKRVNQEEISYGSYDFGRRWDNILRYGDGVEGSSTVPLGSNDFAPNNTTYQSTTSGAIVSTNGNYSGITVYSDVRNGTPNDRHDMTIRQFCYFSDRGKFIPDETDITISAINYTTLLGNLYDSFAQYYPSGYTTDTSNFTGNIRVVLDYFGNHQINPAACAGIAACLFELSGIGTANQGRGICAWEGKYKQDMHQQVQDWSTNLTGQLDFLWKDLMLNYKTMMELLNNVPISDNGARQAANRFMVSYRYTDQVQDINTELSRADRAQSRAAGWFNKIIIRSNTPVGAPTSVTIPIFGNMDNSVGVSTNVADNISTSNAPTPVVTPNPQAGVVYTIPLTQPQTGINTAFTSYSSWYDDWNKSSPQYKLAHMWGNQFGRSCNRGIATINDYYLVAVAPTYGTVGMAIKVILNNSQEFKAIIADVKSPNDPNYCPWGHLDGNGKVNIIEWEVVKVLPNGTAAISGDRYAGYPPDLTGWQGANIVSITNLGTMFDLRWG